VSTALITGFPGFIGRRLVRTLRDEGHDVIALVEPRMLDAARELDSGAELLAGDITDRRLGLSDADYERVAGAVTHVFHLAAIYDLAVPEELARKVNVEGTGNVLELCLAAKGLERLAYVSTAYVAGTRHGVVYEHELGLGQGFKNHYESTKFQAEVWVRELMNRIPTTILRPAIVVGDSKTGETEKFDGPYYLLRVIARAEKLGRPVVQFGAAEASFNVVPVDFVVAAIAAAAFLDSAEGETLHLVDPDPLSAKDLTTLLATEYAGKEPRLRVPSALVQESLRAKPVREMFSGAPRESIVYLNHSVRFDTRRAQEVLGRHGLDVPRFPDYAGPVVEFFKQNEDDPAYQPAK
jgi:nucleoside-diphosphate-sugar epimerase